MIARGVVPAVRVACGRAPDPDRVAGEFVSGPFLDDRALLAACVLVALEALTRPPLPQAGEGEKERSLPSPAWERVARERRVRGQRPAAPPPPPRVQGRFISFRSTGPPLPCAWRWGPCRKDPSGSITHRPSGSTRLGPAPCRPPTSSWSRARRRRGPAEPALAALSRGGQRRQLRGLPWPDGPAVHPRHRRPRDHAREFGAKPNKLLLGNCLDACR